MEDLIRKYLENLNAKYNNETIVTNIPTGFYEIDRITTGFKGGMVYVIGGESGAGKSTFIIRTALFQSEQGYKPYIFSLDEPLDLILSKIIAMSLKIPLRKIETGFLTEEEIEKLVEKSAEMQNSNFNIENTTFFEEIKEKIDLLNPDVVYIDNMSYLSFKNKPIENRYDEIRKILIHLKEIALKNNIPVIITDTIKQPQNEYKKPLISNLIHYNYINGLVDNYILLHKPEMLKKLPSPEEEGIAEIIIAKSKIGSPSNVKLAFIKEIPTFDNILGNPEVIDEEFPFEIYEDDDFEVD